MDTNIPEFIICPYCKREHPNIIAMLAFIINCACGANAHRLHKAVDRNEGWFWSKPTDRKL